MKCPHTIRLKNLCAYCGEEIFTKEKLYNPLHSTDVIQTTEIQRSLHPVLVIDLDHTILFTSLTGYIQRGTSESFSFIQDGVTYFVTLRPFLYRFLNTVAKYFDLSVYTMGTRNYALEILKRIDGDKKYFQDRVITRDENNNKLVKELSRLGINSKDVVILDDRVDVWGYEDNVVLIKPFYLKLEKDFNDPEEILNQSVLSDEGRFNESFRNSKDKDLVETNLKCMTDLNSKDKELLHMSRYLKRIFKKYKKLRNTKKILKKERIKLFRKFHFYFELEDPLADLIRFYRGRFLSRNKIETRRDSFVLKEGKKWRLVRKKWLYNCVYSRKNVSLEGYIEEEIDNSDSDDLEKEYL